MTDMFASLARKGRSSSELSMDKKVVRFSRTLVSFSSEIVAFPSTRFSWGGRPRITARGSLQSGGIPSVRKSTGDTMANSAVRFIITWPKCVFSGNDGTCSLNALSSAFLICIQKWFGQLCSHRTRLFPIGRSVPPHSRAELFGCGAACGGKNGSIGCVWGV